MLRDTTRVFMTFVGCVLFCAAVVGTIESFRGGSAGNGADAGGLLIGIGLAMILIPWLPERSRATQTETDEQESPTTAPASRPAD
jgi:membrane associated rhomboid family serine protease